MYFHNKILRNLRICLLCALSLAVFFSLVGFRDVTSEEIKKSGVKCAFKARIIEKVTDPKGQGLVVIKRFDIERDKGHVRIKKGTESEKGAAETMYVLITRDTEIGYLVDGVRMHFMDFDDLKVDMSVLIEGTKILKKVDDQEIVVVWAKSIEPVE